MGIEDHQVIPRDKGREISEMIDRIEAQAEATGGTYLI